MAAKSLGNLSSTLVVESEPSHITMEWGHGVCELGEKQGCFIPRVFFKLTVPLGGAEVEEWKDPETVPGA